MSTEPGRFARAALHCEAGELEARLSTTGSWDLRIRGGEDRDWRLICSGDLQGGRLAPPAEPEPALRLGPLIIDRLAKRVRVGDTEVGLNRREYELLSALAARPDRLFSKAELLGAWGYPADTRSRVLDSHASRLRNKLRRAGAEGFIVNYRGFGYRLWSAPELAPADGRAAARSRATASGER
jgi:DNA-binding response OmpR family regulator